MAQTENGVGWSFKLSDGTMIWGRRDTWALAREDVRLIFGDEALGLLEAKLGKAWGAGTVAAPVIQIAAPASGAPDELMTPEEVEAELNLPVPAPAPAGPTQGAVFDICPRCGSQKNKWVPPGVSSKTGKAYKGFYACPTRGCPGR